MKIKLLIVSVLSALFCVSVFANPYAKCIEIKNDKGRLQCFDTIQKKEKAVSLPSVEKKVKAVPSPSVEKGSSSSATTQPAIPVADDLFGLEQRVVTEMRKQGEDQLTSTISKVTMGPYKKFTITLANGQRWKQTDSQRLSLRINDIVVIRKAALGSFLLKKQGSKASRRVKRVK